MPDLWPHQRDAIEFATQRESTMFEIPMGYGKTLCAIRALQEWGSRSVLILCPKMVCRSWRRELAKYAPGMFDQIILGPEPVWIASVNGVEGAKKLRKSDTVKKRIPTLKQAVGTSGILGRPFAIVANYDAARQEPFLKWAKTIHWDCIISDEIHKIKQFDGRTSKALARLKSKRRLGLTGTVMPHSPLDVFGQYRFLDPGIFGINYYGFRSRYAIMGGYGMKHVVAFRNQDELREKMGRITFSVAEDKATLGLPDYIDENVIVDLCPKAMKAYKDLLSDISTMIEEGEITASNALTKLTRFQQLTSGSLPTDEGRIVRIDTAKESAIREIIEEAGHEPIVVFGRWRADMTSVENACRDLDEPFSELSGQRNDLARWEHDARLRVLAVQIQAGGTGIDLTKARICVFASTGFNLGEYLQARKRVHRPGQHRAVTYYHLVARNTVDERVAKAIAARENLIDATLGELRRSYA